MSYYKYKCPSCGEYYGDAIPTDEFPIERECNYCKTSDVEHKHNVGCEE